jgi:hypothetical protein
MTTSPCIFQAHIGDFSAYWEKVQVYPVHGVASLVSGGDFKNPAPALLQFLAYRKD